MSSALPHVGRLNLVHCLLMGQYIKKFLYFPPTRNTRAMMNTEAKGPLG